MVEPQLGEGHLSKIRNMSFGVQFWQDLFATHNLFTCDEDGRECRCKQFFTTEVWQDQFYPLADEIIEWENLLEAVTTDKYLRIAKSERFWDLVGEYNAANSRIIEWQAHHARNEEEAVIDRLCSACRDVSENFRTASLAVLIGKESPTPAQRYPLF